ncbi:MAG: hypothetical protein RMJ66_07180, partial [Bacteroidia bacterium]|nr:hypothetical protein [Bacteroidia bacterium]MDW8134836.1 hypothetical protein [Bacteroidia bacterium]
MRWWEWLWETSWYKITLGRWLGAALLLMGGYFIARLLARGLSHLLYLTLGKTRQDITFSELHRLMRSAWLFPFLLIVLYTVGHILHFFHLSLQGISWIQRVFEAL